MVASAMTDVRRTISGTDEDLQRLVSLPENTLKQLFAMMIRNLWRVDGLYFLGIEKTFGTQAATEVDASCWASMAELEARDLKRIFSIEAGNLDALEKTLPLTTWVLDHARKRMTRTADALVFEVLECRTQKARLKKSLPVFPCRPVREGYLTRFAAALGCRCECEVCPPGERDGEVWCRWRFTQIP
jgi:hypothetical protein